MLLSIRLPEVSGNVSNYGVSLGLGTTKGNARALSLVWTQQRVEKEWDIEVKLLREAFPKTG